MLCVCCFKISFEILVSSSLAIARIASLKSNPIAPGLSVLPDTFVGSCSPADSELSLVKLASGLNLASTGAEDWGIFASLVPTLTALGDWEDCDCVGSSFGVPSSFTAIGGRPAACRALWSSARSSPRPLLSASRNDFGEAAVISSCFDFDWNSTDCSTLWWDWSARWCLGELIGDSALGKSGLVLVSSSASLNCNKRLLSPSLCLCVGEECFSCLLWFEDNLVWTGDNPIARDDEPLRAAMGFLSGDWRSSVGCFKTPLLVAWRGERVVVESFPSEVVLALWWLALSPMGELLNKSLVVSCFAWSGVRETHLASLVELADSDDRLDEFSSDTRLLFATPDPVFAVWVWMGDSLNSIFSGERIPVVLGFADSCCRKECCLLLLLVNSELVWGGGWDLSTAAELLDKGMCCRFEELVTAASWAVIGSFESSFSEAVGVIEWVEPLDVSSWTVSESKSSS